MMATTAASASSVLVDQLETEMRIAALPCQFVPDSQIRASSCTCPITRRVTTSLVFSSPLAASKCTRTWLSTTSLRTRIPCSADRRSAIVRAWWSGAPRTTQRDHQPVRRPAGGHRPGDHRGPGAPHRGRLPGQKWLSRHPRITFHFTSTSASWLDQVETWFSILTARRSGAAAWGASSELIALMNTFTHNCNAGASAFAWVKTADEILAKAVRKPRAISESRL